MAETKLKTTVNMEVNANTQEAEQKIDNLNKKVQELKDNTANIGSPKLQQKREQLENVGKAMSKAQFANKNQQEAAEDLWKYANREYAQAEKTGTMEFSSFNDALLKLIDKIKLALPASDDLKALSGEIDKLNNALNEYSTQLTSIYTKYDGGTEVRIDRRKKTVDTPTELITKENLKENAVVQALSKETQELLQNSNKSLSENIALYHQIKDILGGKDARFISQDILKNSGLNINRKEAQNAYKIGSEAEKRVALIVERDLKEATKLNQAGSSALTSLHEAKDKVKENAGGTGTLDKIYSEISAIANNIKQEKTDLKNKQIADKSNMPDGNGNKKLTSQLLGSALLYRTLRKVVSSVINTVKDLDKSLTEQAMVTGKTRAETYALLQSYQQLATQLGSTTKEVAEVATQFIRQGKTIQDSLTLTEAAISAAKVAGISGTESVNYLTTALNGFRLSTDQAMRVSDKFAAIAAQSATSYEELATALSKVASQANLAGMSIDYTTALLAKGIETTREAPETIGTALKTIIARMREMTDYGQTLEGDMDINNVEKQLGYVGIALKNNAGELRSTEDVLNELGQKWDTLNTNQQAAIAKALAGTRQQARLIAMMSDYERVTELQEIAMRSQGATLAQMETYSQGIEASTNRIATAWQSMITNLVDSEVVISLFDIVAKLLETISKFTDTFVGQAIAISTILIAIPSILSGLLVSMNLITEAQAKSFGLAAMSAAMAEKEKGEKIKYGIAAFFGLNLDKYGTVLAAIRAKWEEIITSLKEKQLGLTLATYAIILVILAAIVSIVYVIIRLVKWWNLASGAVEANSKAIDKLSNKIYNLEKTANSIGTVIQKFEDLDNKLIKTKEDAAELKKILDEAANSLSSNKKSNVIKGLGMSEQEYYNTLMTDSARREFLERVQTESLRLANEYREQQLEYANNIRKNATEWKKFTSDSKYLNSRSAIAAIVNKRIQEQVDYLKDQSLATDEAAKATENLVTALNEQLSVEEQLVLANNPQQIKKLINTINGLTVTIDGELHNLSEVIDSEDYSLTERINAYEEILSSLSGSMRKAFQSAYSEFVTLSQFNQETRQFLEKSNYSFDQINKMYAGYETLTKYGISITKQAYQSRFSEYLNALARFNGSVLEATKETFGDILAQQNVAAETVVEAFSSLFQKGLNNIGQDIDKFKNSVSAIYEKASKWAEMSETDKTQFLTENQYLFETLEDRARFLEALESGNYAMIQEVLMHNESLLEDYNRTVKEIEQELQFEREKGGNSEYIKYLEQELEKIKDINKAFQASWDLQVKQQEQMLSEYKSALQAEQKALEDSLKKRKEAYQKYFDEINQTVEDNDYEEKAALYIANLSKLAGSTNASAREQSKSIEKSLKDLEKERLDTLRQRAQEQVISNIDKQLDEINNKFDELINSNKLLLQAMLSDAASPADFASQILSNNLDNATYAEAQRYLIDFKTIFGSILPASVLDQISIGGDQSNFTLNINNEQIQLGSASQKTLFAQIMRALKQAGVNTNI